jgi:HEAT repeat protein
MLTLRGKAPMKKAVIACCMLWLGAGLVSGQDPASSPDETKAAKEEAFKRSLKVIETSTDKDELLAAMKTLREGLPDSTSLLVETAEKGSVRGRCFAIQVLGENGNAAEHLKVLVPCLEHSSPRVRFAAAMAIRRLGKAEGGLEAILEYLPREADANNRKMAIKTLQQWGDKAAVPVLVKVLKTETDKGVRNFLVTALEAMTKEKLGEDVRAWEAYVESQISQEQAKELIRSNAGKKVRS